MRVIPRTRGPRFQCQSSPQCQCRHVGRLQNQLWVLTNCWRKTVSFLFFFSFFLVWTLSPHILATTVNTHTHTYARIHVHVILRAGVQCQDDNTQTPLSPKWPPSRIYRTLISAKPLRPSKHTKLHCVFSAAGSYTSQGFFFLFFLFCFFYYIYTDRAYFVFPLPSVMWTSRTAYSPSWNACVELCSCVGVHMAYVCVW